MNLEAIKAAALAAIHEWPGDFDNDILTPIGRHIATANPATVLELVAEIERNREVIRQALYLIEFK